MTTPPWGDIPLTITRAMIIALVAAMTDDETIARLYRNAAGPWEVELRRQTDASPLGFRLRYLQWIDDEWSEAQ